MNCSIHPDAAAVAFCRACGKALCEECRRVAAGTVYCAEHAPDSGAGAPPGTAYPSATAAPEPTHPRLAFVLGLIPGVGAIYNGQYAKGLMHAIIFGLFISILDSNAARGLEPLVAILLAAFVLYMAFEAFHTARRRQLGEPVEEFSGVFDRRHANSSGGAVALIILGAVFLLNTLDIIEMRQILRFWPVLLIILGVNMLHSRMSERSGPGREGPRGE
jgi:Domain of unknown function (DUF5668)